MFAETDEGATVPAVDGERKDATLADVGESVNQHVIPRAEHPEVRFGAEIGEAPVQAGNRVVGLRAGGQPFQDVAACGVDHHKPAIGAAIPPAGGRIQLPSVGSDAGPINPCPISAVPQDPLGLEIKRAELGACAGVINRMVPGVAAEATGSWDG